jgi:hypothetical protein
MMGVMKHCSATYSVVEECNQIGSKILPDFYNLIDFISIV